MEFVVDKVAQAQVSFCAVRSSAVSVTPPVCSTFIILLLESHVGNCIFFLPENFSFTQKVSDIRVEYYCLCYFSTVFSILSLVFQHYQCH